MVNSDLSLNQVKIMSNNLTVDYLDLGKFGTFCGHLDIRRFELVNSDRLALVNSDRSLWSIQTSACGSFGP